VTTIRVITAIATMYTSAQHAGQPLFCGGTFADTTAPWVALPFEQYNDAWQCGDLVVLSFVGADATEHVTLTARAMDTGPFGAHCVVRGNRCVPIVADVPEPHWPTSLDGDISAAVRVVNVTAACREWGYCD